MNITKVTVNQEFKKNNPDVKSCKVKQGYLHNKWYTINLTLPYELDFNKFKFKFGDGTAFIFYNVESPAEQIIFDFFLPTETDLAFNHIVPCGNSYHIYFCPLEWSLLNVMIESKQLPTETIQIIEPTSNFEFTISKDGELKGK